MVSKWVITPIYPIYKWVITHLLTIDPNFLGHPSMTDGLQDFETKNNPSGQIIATSHDLTPHGRVVGEPCLKWPYFREIQVGEIL